MTFTLRERGGLRFASKREALKAATPLLVEFIRLELEEERAHDRAISDTHCDHSGLGNGAHSRSGDRIVDRVDGET